MRSLLVLAILFTVRSGRAGDFVIQVDCSDETVCEKLQEMFETRIPEILPNETASAGPLVLLRDFDECDNQLSFCSINARCINVFRTFSCECLRGFETDATGTCTDVNECEGGHDCLPIELCRNTEGGYTCSCQLNSSSLIGNPCADLPTTSEQATSSTTEPVSAPVHSSASTGTTDSDSPVSADIAKTHSFLATVSSAPLQSSVAATTNNAATKSNTATTSAAMEVTGDVATVEASTSTEVTRANATEYPLNMLSSQGFTLLPTSQTRPKEPIDASPATTVSSKTALFTNSVTSAPSEEATSGERLSSTATPMKGISSSAYLDTTSIETPTHSSPDLNIGNDTIEKILNGDISEEAVMMILSDILSLLSAAPIPEDAARQVIDIFDNFASSDEVFSAEVAAAVTVLVDRVLSTMSLETGVFQLKGSSLTVAALDVGRTPPPSAFALGSGLNSSSGASIELPASLYSTPGQRISFAGYSDASLFPADDVTIITGALVSSQDLNDSFVVNSAVIGSSLNGTIVQSLRSPVTLRLPTIAREVSSIVRDNSTTLRTALYSPRCVFFDYELRNGLGDWSDEGCVTITSSNLDVTCQCNHLTNFAVLMSVEKVTDDHVLDLLTLIGCSISIIGLATSIITYSLFKQLRKHKSKQILLNFCIALCGVYVVYVFSIASSLPSNQSQCIAGGFLLHFFITATFCWMLMEVLDMYLMFVKVWSGASLTVVKVCLFAWGFPALLSLATLGGHLGLEMAFPGDQWLRMYPTYRDTVVCWMSTLGLYWALLLPLGVILLVNVVLFSVVIYHVTCKRARSSMTRVRSNSQHVKARHHALNALAILLLSGPTWVVGFLINLDPVQDGVARRILSYVFVFLNAFQGLWVFIVFTARPRAVRSAWMSLLRGETSLKQSARGWSRYGTKSNTSSTYLSRANRRKSSAVDAVHAVSPNGSAEAPSHADKSSLPKRLSNAAPPCSPAPQYGYRGRCPQVGADNNDLSEEPPKNSSDGSE